ncbi:hypothetical protein IU501_01155 [Nocardia otitidiscaviarum]|uniref:hypothetical protein n=1 Tax=Nocardia otitidiscaviarum TaxID=1823 RepID=UPI0011DD29E2|nr:hypothetical protein [Nocardia otitidiscaviarum]MBF6131612.1 hypothetical protein [Nocardia otitidiscaviarum]MBF6482744.1 hypothetical protein [Nocardia otitidiscaviarum]
MSDGSDAVGGQRDGDGGAGGVLVQVDCELGDLEQSLQQLLGRGVEIELEGARESMIESNRTQPIRAYAARIWVAVCALLSGVSLLGCGADRSDASPTTSTAAGAADRPSFDPPKALADQAVSQLNNQG